VDGEVDPGAGRRADPKQSPDRNAQFRYLSEQAREYRAAGQPVISVDTKKKEQVGDFRNAGREWQRAGEPARVRDHDFPDPVLGKVAPYGVYDVAADAGWVSVGLLTGLPGDSPVS
jgi:hypothetical protein